MLYVVMSGDRQLPVGIANGSFRNPGIGTLVLQNGKMAVNGQHVSYVVEADKEVAYLLPSAYVGVSARGFIVNRGGRPLKMRLDDPTQNAPCRPTPCRRVP